MGGVLKDLNTVNSLLEDSKQRLWIASEHHGLLCYDGKSVKYYFNQPGQTGNVLSICESKEGKIYIATSNAGLFRLDGDTPVHIEATGNKHISTLYVSQEGNILLGYDGLGLGIYNPKDNTLRDNPIYSRDVDLSTAKVYSICEDHNGNLWLGLLQKGIYMHPRKNTGFNYMGYKLGTRNTLGTASVTSAFVSQNGYRWIGTDKDGLYCVTEEGRVVKHFKENFPATILGITEDLQGNVWVGSYKEGCGRINTKTLNYTPYPLPQGNSLSIFDLDRDCQGHIWLGTMGQGLLRVTPETGEVKAYTMDDRAGEDRHVNSIANNYISQIAISPDGKRIYAATTMGVCAMDLKTESWLSTFNSNCPNYLSEL